jgi:hypothetical protein
MSDPRKKYEQIQAFSSMPSMGEKIRRGPTYTLNTPHDIVIWLIFFLLELSGMHIQRPNDLHAMIYLFIMNQTL